MCTLCHETHENTTEASDHAPQVAEIFIGFFNSFFGKSITGVHCLTRADKGWAVKRARPSKKV